MSQKTRGRRLHSRRRQAGPATGDPFDLLGFAPSAGRILRYFAIRPEARPHARLLQRVLGLGGASLQRELERLLVLGALERSEEGRLVRYRVAPNSPLWTAFRVIIGTTSDPTGLVREALCDVPGVQAAFLFGSSAQETRSDDSDVDVFVVEGSAIDRRTLLRQLAEVAALIGREVNTVRYTPQALAERLGNPDHPASHFVREVLAGPKRWVAGASANLEPLATAAGLRMRDLPAVTA